MEDFFLKRINQIVGEHQMNKIRGMLQDIVNSKKTNKDFTDFLAANQHKYPVSKQLDLEIYLLTKPKWPSEILQLDVCKPPTDLSMVMTAFDRFFLTGTQGTGKKVDWLLGEGQVEVVARYKSGRKNLTLSVPQYTVLSILENANPQMKLPL